MSDIVHVKSGDSLPKNDGAEIAVIGGILIENEAIENTIGIITAKDFYAVKHGVIYQAMRDLHEERQPVDILTLAAILTKRGQLDIVGGVQYITWLSGQVPATTNIGVYAHLIREASFRRSMVWLSQQLELKALRDDVTMPVLLNYAESEVLRLGSEQVGEGGLTRVRDSVEAALKYIHNLTIRQDAITGVPSGFSSLDSMTAGFQKTDLIIIAGRPSMGKTSFAVDVMKNTGKLGIPSAFFSVEMPNSTDNPQITLRLLYSLSSVSSHSVRTGQITQDEITRINVGAEMLYDLPIYIDDTPGPLSEIRSKLRKAVKEHGIKLAVIDYLQLMDSDGDDAHREQEISKRTRSLKMLAKALNIPIIVLSQLNRSLEQRTDKRPIMSDLRESGSIEQDADVIIFLYRDKVYNKEVEEHLRERAEAIIAKQRNGPIGTAYLRFEESFSRFSDWNDQP